MEDTIITNDNTNDVLETNEPISPNPTEIAIEEDNRDVPTVEEATPTDELPIQEEPVADNVENPVPEEVGAEQDSLQIENNDIELNEPTQENIVDQNANETAEEVTPVDEEVANSQEQLPTASDLPLEETDNEADTLLQNESEAVSSPDEAIENTELETTNQETPAAEEMTLDLDSLTEDMGMPENQESTPMQQANKETPAAIPAVTTSVPLPNATAVQSKGVKNASKKKAFAMIAAFVALLIVGGFVFNTMMPQESDNLVANIL